MPTVKVYNLEGKEVDSIELQDEIFNCPINEHVIYLAIKYQMAKRRRGTLSTKTRGEVRGGGKKPFKQKGTGRARAGSIRSPLWRGGGIIFGPKPRDFSIDLPKKVRRLALRQAVASRLQEKSFYVIDDFKFDSPKTKKVVNLMKVFEVDKILLVDNKDNTNLSLSSRNIYKAKFLPPEGLNVYDILKYENLFVSRGVIDKITERIN